LGDHGLDLAAIDAACSHTGLHFCCCSETKGSAFRIAAIQYTVIVRLPEYWLARQWMTISKTGNGLLFQPLASGASADNVQQAHQPT
jgi:hypothetical protein